MTTSEIIEQYVLDAVGSPYVYGATGKKCTLSLRQQQARQYPDCADAIKKNCPKWLKNTPCRSCKYNGKLAYDCAQLVRMAAKQAGISMVSGATSQWSKTNWISCGEISEKPECVLAIVFRKSGDKMQHVGIMLPDGSSVHAKGHAYGVVHDRSYKWTHYGILKDADNMQNEKNVQRNNEKLSTGIATLIAQKGSTVNVRQTPNGKVITALPIGSTVQVEKVVDGWAMVTYQECGYIREDFLKGGATDAAIG